MKISVSLGNLDRAVKQLERYAKKLESSTDEIDRRLSEIAADEARERYRGGIAVTAEEHGVTATGDSVVFQEFGAGATVVDPFPGGADVTSIEIMQGSYSRERRGPYWASGYESWEFGGRAYTQVEPTNALFFGMLEAKDRAGEVAREVLNGD